MPFFRVCCCVCLCAATQNVTTFSFSAHDFSVSELFNDCWAQNMALSMTNRAWIWCAFSFNTFKRQFQYIEFKSENSFDASVTPQRKMRREFCSYIWSAHLKSSMKLWHRKSQATSWFLNVKKKNGNFCRFLMALNSVHAFMLSEFYWEIRCKQNGSLLKG